MEAKCQIIRETNDPAPHNLMRVCCERTLKKHAGSNKLVTIVLVGLVHMRQLNKNYHHSNEPTDVLSFPSNDKIYLGEVVICPIFIRAKAHRKKHSIHWEFCHAAVHGTLHLLGMSHSTDKEYSKMHTMEEKIIASVLKQKTKN